MIKARIDVTKINKKRLYKGNNGTYLDIVLIETPENKFADYMVSEAVTEKELQMGVMGTILGNGKIMGYGGGSQNPKKHNTHDPKNTKKPKKAEPKKEEEPPKKVQRPYPQPKKEKTEFPPPLPSYMQDDIIDELIF